MQVTYLRRPSVTAGAVAVCVMVDGCFALAVYGFRIVNLSIFSALTINFVFFDSCKVSNFQKASHVAFPRDKIAVVFMCSSSYRYRHFLQKVTKFRCRSPTSDFRSLLELWGSWNRMIKNNHKCLMATLLRFTNQWFSLLTFPECLVASLASVRTPSAGFSETKEKGCTE